MRSTTFLPYVTSLVVLLGLSACVMSKNDGTSQTDAGIGGAGGALGGSGGNPSTAGAVGNDDGGAAGSAGSVQGGAGGSNQLDAGNAGDAGMDATLIDDPSCPPSSCRTLATGQAQPRSIVVDATNVYWVNQGTTPQDHKDGGVMKMSLSGGEPIALAQGMEALSIAVDGSSVYWEQSDLPGDTIYRIPITGGTPEKLVTNVSPGSMAVNGTFLYFVNFSTAAGTALPIAGDPPALNGGAFATIEIDTTHVYFPTVDTTGLTTVYGNHIIVSMPITGGGLTLLAASLGQVGSLTVDGTNVYWGDNIRDTIELASLLDGERHTLATAQEGPFDIEVNDGNVYWAASNNGKVMKVPIGGGTPVVLASGQDPLGIAVDATSVYWTNYGRGQIRVTSK